MCLMMMEWIRSEDFENLQTPSHGSCGCMFSSGASRNKASSLMKPGVATQVRSSEKLFFCSCMYVRLRKY